MLRSMVFLFSLAVSGCSGVDRPCLSSWPMSASAEPAVIGVIFHDDGLVPSDMAEFPVVWAVWADAEYTCLAQVGDTRHVMHGYCAGEADVLKAMRRIGSCVRETNVGFLIHSDVAHRSLLVDDGAGSRFELFCDDDIARQIEELANDPTIALDELGRVVADDWSSRFPGTDSNVRRASIESFARSWAYCWRQLGLLRARSTETILDDATRPTLGEVEMAY